MMKKLHYQETVSEKERKDFGRYLNPGEELLLVTGLSKVYLVLYFLLKLLWPGIIFPALGLGIAYLAQFNFNIGLGIGLILAGIVALSRTLVFYHSNRYLLTNRRIIIKKGILIPQVTSVLYEKIIHIEVRQSLLGRLFTRYGTVVVNSAGADRGETFLSFISYPLEFKNLLEKFINREREQSGLKAQPLVTVEGELV